MRRAAVATLLIASAMSIGAPAAIATVGDTTIDSAQLRGPDRVVLISVPGVMWSDLARGGLPALEKLMPSVAAMSARTGARAPNLERGYLTLGAGNPAFVALFDPLAHEALEADASFENGDAADAAARRSGRAISGAIVYPSVALLQRLQDDRLYGSVVGSLGEALRGAGVRRAVVSAADIAVKPEAQERRRAAVLALMDKAGAVDYGRLDGLLEANPAAPFGVSTDADAFVDASRRAVDRADVVLLDVGETSRADEYLRYVAPERASEIRRAALERTDAIVARIQRLLTARDLVLVLTPTGPTAPGFREHLGPIGAWGTAPDGDRIERSWLLSPTTRRDGLVVLSDVAPTILRAFDIDRTKSMVGTPINTGRTRTGGIGALMELDVASSVREAFATTAFWTIGAILAFVAILAFIVFLGPPGGPYRLLVAVSYFGLALFPAAHIIRAFEFWWLGVLGAHAALYIVAAALAIAAWRLPGPRWRGGVALMLLTVLLFASDVVVGGPLQLNGVFGHSPLVAGRFYGVSNPGYAILFAAALLGVTGLVELRRGRRTLPAWAIVALAAILPIIGLPQMGADFGGLLAGVPAVGVTVVLGRGWRVRWRTAVMLGIGAVVVAVGLSFVDYARDAESRTHLGRFAETLVAGDLDGLFTIVQRKAAASIGSLAVTRWTYFIPVGLAVLALLLARPRGVLRDVLRRRPLLAAGLWGTLVAGALGFAVNDSGISIPALVLAFVVPFLVLIAVDTIAPRKLVAA